MQVSGIGLLVCACLYGFGWLLGSPLIIGLIASLAFGTTSALTLSAVGGSSPLIYLVFAAALVASVAGEKRFMSRLRRAFTGHWIGWVIGAMAVYAAASAYILPRLFAGVTSAFVTARDKGVAEVALAPNSGNLTQTGYFVLGALTALVLLSLDKEDGLLTSLAKGFFCWAAVVAIGGIVDLAAKMVGAGDIFLPIRTASFAFLTEDEQAGFFRINGLYSEASSFAAAALAAMAFAYTMWKNSGSRLALAIAAVLLVLLVLSTSSTAYAGLAVLIIPTCAFPVLSWISNRLGRDSLLVFGCIACGVALVICVIAYDDKLMEPFQKLLKVTVLDKSQSESGRERAHWNERSLETLLDTWGLGIGFGSSRTSNWLVAILSQLGLLGTALQLCLLIPFLHRPVEPRRAAPDHKVWVLHKGLRACALVTLLSAVISGGSADPGLLFFVALASTVLCQKKLRRGKSPDSRPSRLSAAVSRAARSPA